MFRSAGLYVNAVHPAFLISNRARKNNAPLVFKQIVVVFVIEITYGYNCCHCLFLSEVFASISISYLNTKSRSCHYTYSINRLIRIISFLLIFQFSMIPETTKDPESILHNRIYLPGSSDLYAPSGHIHPVYFSALIRISHCSRC